MSPRSRLRAAQEPAYRLDEFANRDRLGQISFATARKDAFLIAFHREGGDGNHRNVPQLQIVFQMLGDLQPRDLWQLNIHQDQIRTMLTRQVERFDAVAGCQSGITVRFQKIVEELHIELVVLHNQDGFGHPRFPYALSRRNLGG